MPADPAQVERSKDWPKGLRLVRDVITEAMVESGLNHRVGGDGDPIRATTLQAARALHRSRYVSTGDGDREVAERQAWSRNIKAARERQLVGSELHAGQELIWLF